jgi:phosphohistidine phosphatase SixA
MLHLLSSISLATGFATAAIDSTELRREPLMDALRKGGYTVLLRHARTDRSYDEQRDPVPTLRTQQRNLSDDGVKDAALMGVVFKRNGIRFAEIISSPMYRCLETAEYAVGTPTSITMALRVFPPTTEQAALVLKAPRAGTNRLIVTHHFVIETHVPGIKPGDVGESEAAVVRHTADGKVELVGRITLDDWRLLANPEAVRSEVGATAHTHTSAAQSDTDSGAAVAIPDSHAGHIAREYIAAFNTGSPDKMKAFLEAWMVPNPDRSMDDRLKNYTQLYADHGTLTPTAVHRSAQLEVELGMKSRRGDFRLTVKSTEEHPMRGSSITFAVGSHR